MLIWLIVSLEPAWALELRPSQKSWEGGLGKIWLRKCNYWWPSSSPLQNASARPITCTRAVYRSRGQERFLSPRPFLCALVRLWLEVIGLRGQQVLGVQIGSLFLSKQSLALMDTDNPWRSPSQVIWILRSSGSAHASMPWIWSSLK